MAGARDKKKQPKPMAARLAEMTSAYKQLDQLGLSPQLEGILEFKRIANRFVRDGEPASGEIHLVGFQRILMYDLSIQPHIQSRVLLRYREDV